MVRCIRDLNLVITASTDALYLTNQDYQWRNAVYQVRLYFVISISAGDAFDYVFVGQMTSPQSGGWGLTWYRDVGIGFISPF